MTGQPPPVAYIEAGKLHPDEGNRPEKSGQENLAGMAATIRVLGVLVPLWVVAHPRRQGHYIIKDGHQRYTAGQMAGLGEFPCTLRRPTAAEAKAGPLLAQIVMQVQRTPWSPGELARKFGRLRDEAGLSQADIARLCGLKEGTVSYHMELLDLSEENLAQVEARNLSVGAAHQAVRAARAAGLRPGGTTTVTKTRKPYERPRKPAPHFTAAHPAAAEAARLCKTARCEPWTRIGKVACGTHWDRAIGNAAVQSYRDQQARDAHQAALDALDAYQTAAGPVFRSA